MCLYCFDEFVIFSKDGRQYTKKIDEVVVLICQA